MFARAAGFVIFVALAAAAPRASAAPPSEPDALDELYDEAHPQPIVVPSPPKHGAWYGWQILLADAAFIGVFASVPAWGDLGDGGGAALAFDAVGFAFAAPIIHASHGNREKSGISLVLHVGFGAAGLAIGFAAGLASPCTCGPNDWLCFCSLSQAGWGAYAGTLAGAGLASFIDAAALAWEKPEPRSSTSSMPAVQWSLAPTALRGGAALCVGATF